MTHPLTAYIAASGATQADFAKRIGRTQAYVSRLCASDASPSLTTALRIERATNGAVPVATWANEESAA